MKIFIKNLIKSELPKEEGIRIIEENKDLTSQEKLLVRSYVYPRHIGDYELPIHIKNYLGENGKGFLYPDNGESCILVEAYRSSQYGRFIRHLFHSYTNPEKINPVSGFEEDKCPICGKTIYQYDKWLDLVTKVRPGTPEKDNQEYLSWGSQDSGVPICKNCLIQLINAYNLIQSIEGNNFLQPKYKKLF